jgi:hypothetical protein
MLAKHKVGSSTLLTRSILKPLDIQGLFHFCEALGVVDPSEIALLIWVCTLWVIIGLFDVPCIFDLRCLDSVFRFGWR